MKKQANLSGSHSITEKYHEIISELKLGKRPRLNFSSEDKEVLKTFLSLDSPCLEEALCLLAHSQKGDLSFCDEITALIENQKTFQSYFHFTLENMRKHIIEASRFAGKKPPAPPLLSLMNALENLSEEQLLWAIDFIEEIGPQKVIFNKKLLELLPSKFSVIFSSQKRKVLRRILSFIKQ